MRPSVQIQNLPIFSDLGVTGGQIISPQHKLFPLLLKRGFKQFKSCDGVLSLSEDLMHVWRIWSQSGACEVQSLCDLGSAHSALWALGVFQN